MQAIGQAGEKTAYYLLIIVGVLAVVAFIFSLLFLYWKFKLHKYQIQQQWEYKNRVADKYGLIILRSSYDGTSCVRWYIPQRVCR